MAQISRSPYTTGWERSRSVKPVWRSLRRHPTGPKHSLRVVTLIERIKQIVPIWMHEFFEGGDVWIEGATADPDDAEAREDAYRKACV